MAEFGWAYVAGNVISEAQGLTGSVLLKKGQTEISGSPNLVFNTGSNILELGGTLSASSALTASGLNLYGLQAGTATSNSYLAVDSNFNVVLTSSAGGGSGIQGGGGGGGFVGVSVAYIGAAEDGDYTDGLYTDFATDTRVGTAVDRFNEVLKILAPSPAPALDEINYDNTVGTSAKLSFGASAEITGYTSSATTTGFASIDIGQVYQSATSGDNFRLGVYDGTTDITGFLNYSIAQSSTNGNIAYSADAFGNANDGTLKLELNGTVIHSASLEDLVGAGDPASGTGTSLTGDSGFTNVSVTASSYDGNGSEWYLFKHRTAKFKIDVNEQKVGWNYARVIHTLGTTDYATNYIEWINDPSGAVNDLSITNARIEDITTEGSVYLSGVEYNTQLTASYKAELNNIYRNVYPTGNPISFSSTRATTPSSQALTDLTAGSHDETAFFPITASFNRSGVLYPSQTIGQSVSVTHPLKDNLVNQGSATATGFLIFDDTPPTTTNLIETFINETYRITSGSYDTQGAASSATWDSEVHLTSSGTSGYNDGLVQIGTQQYSGRIYSPVASALPSNGDFASMANGAAGNPDYSGETGVRTYFRKIQNTSGQTKYDMEFSTTKGGTFFNNSTLGTGNAHFFIKIPGATGWMDVSQNFSYGNVSDGDGALINGASNDTDDNSNVHHITFGTASVAANEYVVIKMVANSTWTGYLSELNFTFGASSQTPVSAPVLDDIDLDVTGIDAFLSFGSSNAITDYSNVQGSGLGSMSNINSNQLYSVTGDRRGIFTSQTNINGTLNEDVAASSNNYSADSFFNGYSGSLRLEVNGTVVHTVDLESTLNSITNDFNGNNSGFNLSAVNFSTTNDGIPSYIKPWRTGTYQIGSSDQRVGWNYARVLHGTEETNYVEWVIDPSGSVDDLTVTNSAISNFGHTDKFYQSGIGYFASNPTGSYTCQANNFYRNVYSNSNNAVRMFISTNCDVTNIRITGSGIHTTSSAPVEQDGIPMGKLNNTANCEETSFDMTGSLRYSGASVSISDDLGLFTSVDVSGRSQVLHPFKNGGYVRGTNLTKSSFMVYSGSIGSTNLNTNEYFNTEHYRIVSGNYANQSDVTSSSNSWDSTTSINDGTSPEYNDGMVTVNGYAISPLNIGNSGDTRNVDDGGTLQSPDNNPDYSTLNEDVRTFYRYFRNETGLSKATFSVKLYGDATIVAKSGAFYTGTLGANKNINVELKVPYDPNFTGLDDTSTAWGDVIKPYSAGTQPTTDGVGIYSGGGTGLDQTVDSNGTTVGVQLQQKQVRDDQYFVVKISAHKDWTGYLSRIEIIY